MEKVKFDDSFSITTSISNKELFPSFYYLTSFRLLITTIYGILGNTKFVNFS